MYPESNDAKKIEMMEDSIMYSIYQMIVHDKEFIKWSLHDIIYYVLNKHELDDPEASVFEFEPYALDCLKEWATR